MIGPTTAQTRKGPKQNHEEMENKMAHDAHI